MTQPFTLSWLLSPWLDLSQVAFSQLEVSELELDSRKISSGMTFVAINGHEVDGRNFIDAAISNGANCVIAQACKQHVHASIEIKNQVPVVYMDELSTHLSALAARLYPRQQSRLIGVTGTNGKTTISQLIAQWLELTGVKAAVMGTTGNGFLSNLTPALNTTGSAIEIQKTLHQLELEGAQVTALEVSSHGLVQNRVKATSFDVGVFSNLSRDHLDYHHTMEEYADAKLMLFTQHDTKKPVINIDDEVGKRWMTQLPDALAVSLQAPLESYSRVLWAKAVSYSEQGIEIQFDGAYGSGTLNVPLIGQFNASNVLLAFGALLELGIDKALLVQHANTIKPVIGRMELFQSDNQAKVVVDYAHTPDALEKALQALKVHCNGKLWAIFGCGGDRDVGKRPMMGEIAERLADHVIVTDDNPRSEGPDIIVTDILRGTNTPNKVLVEHDRFKALAHALNAASPEDIILLAGKGHEDYQVMENETVHYSDRESANTLLGLNS
ncbi:UDP-N-acetylmuramoyl-L-alanyl-D-glutamate--2,6-diaminopimelate ligase [Vibrio sp. S4M6]|uniref:UDP-N-acetylmuramoyl-L-alanyl-D-glutamate--2, 6-diaminopimelate ligase n=1 Tax=Vibrio sinus TaxID=2946865 RepID=UPI00202A202C|nr:UDP-N-acetylmuramoyl-L-alanyl-D-glutamate--2,6-diaminopimelate ligase [Vibrio sinus]MCL9781476.1 UDP-N-acetylmuramoyl-L-alanyl-D-glutamate--2,6-diaminopimelate ligase [Vibrio sinus]